MGVRDENRQLKSQNSLLKSRLRQASRKKRYSLCLLRRYHTRPMDLKAWPQVQSTPPGRGTEGASYSHTPVSD
jgi:hypothetical protein